MTQSQPLYFKTINHPSVIKVEQITSCWGESHYRWESYCLNGDWSSFGSQIYAFLPDWDKKAEPITKAEYNVTREAVLSELNLFVLPIAKVSKEPIEL